MNAQYMAAGALALSTLLLAGCDAPGRPKPGPEVSRPEAVLSFDVLYGDNCAGCHGANGQNGAATNLANPEYQAFIDDASLRKIITEGQPGTLMPAFNKRNGGDLTDEQIETILHGMRARWSGASPFAGQTPPPYRAAHPGDVLKGEAVYAAACARCHGTDASHPGKDGNILDGTFLALVNEQTVRTTIVAGRPDIDQPDWRGNIPGRAMTDDEITNVTAWMMAQKPSVPGQPYPMASAALQPASVLSPKPVAKASNREKQILRSPPPN